MFVAIDRTSKFAFVELDREARQRTAANFLRRGFLDCADHVRM